MDTRKVVTAKKLRLGLLESGDITDIIDCTFLVSYFDKRIQTTSNRTVRAFNDHFNIGI